MVSQNYFYIFYYKSNLIFYITPTEKKNETNFL
jgi:hypothetical protein